MGRVAARRTLDVDGSAGLWSPDVERPVYRVDIGFWCPCGSTELWRSALHRLDILVEGVTQTAEKEKVARRAEPPQEQLI